MKAHDLTAPQQTQAAAHKAAYQKAQSALVAAQQSYLDYLRTAAGLAANARVQLSDDGMIEG